MSKESKKLIANNKKAYHEYFLEEKYGEIPSIVFQETRASGQQDIL